MGGLAALSSSSTYSPLAHFLLQRSRRPDCHSSRLSIKAYSEAESEAQTLTSSSPASKSPATEEVAERKAAGSDGGGAPLSSSLNKEISQAVRKTAATFAPRSSTKSKNPAVPGSTLYTVFEVQGYVSMAFGGLLSYNLIFPSSDPDIWRLMGMWSVWMFTIPSLRARDCSSKEKDALNYLFLGIPLINVLLPLFWKSFAAVWTADVVAFFVTYAWKLNWLSPDQTTTKN
ncbi:hypothetical protein GOP47_0015707 [Adiantum capillus-veneris]|uniref:Uncharacterized protein n=1 Tax=Adiantum capillus-veneris TaxID=13818 RepID=A0A9D4UL40_ADICA|nr:hypothetical protein GOP47_0015707 [Adiantum capillus-veneris]